MAGAFYWSQTGVGLTNLAQTFTHSLSITPSLLMARVMIHQAVVTCTAPTIVNTIGTNVITASIGVGTLTTCDIEVQQIHSIID